MEQNVFVVKLKNNHYTVEYRFFLYFKLLLDLKVFAVQLYCNNVKKLKHKLKSELKFNLKT